jgi:predicted short-subunit dehydrogenase-like oxidoreductase (DUF2520 family)
MSRISLLGAGKVGATLGRVFARAGCEIGDIASRSRASAEQARGIIGSGRVVGALHDLGPAEILIVAVGDNALYGIAETLAASPAVGPGTVVFHCSGAAASSVLAPLRDRGAHVASVHPVMTFTDPLRDAESFAGAWCAIEGDPEAVERLSGLFETAGARLFPIAGERKLTYHAANVFLSNYLVPLIEAGLQCYERAGVPRETAAQAVEPLLRATVDNALKQGGPRALTGPIARGDDRVVAAQLGVLDEADPRAGPAGGGPGRGQGRRPGRAARGDQAAARGLELWPAFWPAKPETRASAAARFLRRDREVPMRRPAEIAEARRLAKNVANTFE